MDYDRNSFAKSIEYIATLYDVRYAYNKNKHLLHSDEGLKDKFKKRITSLIRHTDEVTGEVSPASQCPLLISAVEEILENLEDELEEVRPRFKATLEPVTEIVVEPERVKKEEPKTRPSPFKRDSNNLEEFFYKRSNTDNLLEEVSLEVIKKALENNDYNLTRTSKVLGISHRTLRTKIREIKKRE